MELVMGPKRAKPDQPIVGIDSTVSNQLRVASIDWGMVKLLAQAKIGQKWVSGC